MGELDRSKPLGKPQPIGGNYRVVRDAPRHYRVMQKEIAISNQPQRSNGMSHCVYIGLSDGATLLTTHIDPEGDADFIANQIRETFGQNKNLKKTIANAHKDEHPDSLNKLPKDVAENALVFAGLSLDDVGYQPMVGPMDDVGFQVDGTFINYGIQPYDFNPDNVQESEWDCTSEKWFSPVKPMSDEDRHKLRKMIGTDLPPLEL